jgi:hypothetical protein
VQDNRDKDGITQMRRGVGGGEGREERGRKEGGKDERLKEMQSEAHTETLLERQRPTKQQGEPPRMKSLKT